MYGCQQELWFVRCFAYGQNRLRIRGHVSAATDRLSRVGPLEGRTAAIGVAYGRKEPIPSLLWSRMPHIAFVRALYHKRKVPEEELRRHCPPARGPRHSESWR